MQNQKWAEQRLLRGVEYAKEGKFAEAVRCYSEAIDLVPKYAEAYTARGAAFFFPTGLMRRLVKMGKYKESVTNFETALHIDEKTPNAKQYLERALAMQQGRPSIRTSELLTPAPALKPVVPSVKTTEIDKHLLELMQKEGMVLGGEQSGHIIFLDYMPTGDGQLAALQLLSILSHSKKKASELASAVRQYPQLRIIVRVSSNDQKTAIMQSASLQSAIRAAEEELGENGRVLIRPAGTEPRMRVMVEAGTQQQAQAVTDRLVQHVENLQKTTDK